MWIKLWTIDLAWTIKDNTKANTDWAILTNASVNWVTLDDSWTNTEFLAKDWTYQTVASWTSSSTQTSVTAWEDISAGDAIVYSEDIYELTNLITQDSWDNWWLDNDNTYWYNTNLTYQRQTFTIDNTIDNLIITLSLNKVGSPTDNTIVWIYKTSDNSLITNEVTINNIDLTTSYAEYIITLNWTLTLTSNEAYYIRVGRDWANDTNNYMNWQNSSGNTYSEWVWYYWKDDWTTWASSSRDHTFRIDTNALSTPAWYYKSDASTTLTNFVWFASETVLSGNSLLLDTAWVNSNQSGLSVGSEYYLGEWVSVNNVSPLNSPSNYSWNEWGWFVIQTKKKLTIETVHLYNSNSWDMRITDMSWNILYTSTANSWVANFSWAILEDSTQYRVELSTDDRYFWNTDSNTSIDIDYITWSRNGNNESQSINITSIDTKEIKNPWSITTIWTVKVWKSLSATELLINSGWF